MSPTGCLIIIGNEILSGRTADANSSYIARALTAHGINLREIRVIPDRAEFIIEAVQTCRARFDHVFTTGGIGPTHDDITAESIAAAFGDPLVRHDETFELLSRTYEKDEFNVARQKMAYLPRGATPIANKISLAPGFSLGNVHVMAGVPKIMQSMLGALLPTLVGGLPFLSCAWHTNLREGQIAEGLEGIQKRFSMLDIGSYPFYRKAGTQGITLLAKGTDPHVLNRASDAIKELIVNCGGEAHPGEPLDT